jgi:hypothetical protein
MMTEQNAIDEIDNARVVLRDAINSLDVSDTNTIREVLEEQLQAVDDHLTSSAQVLKLRLWARNGDPTSQRIVERETAQRATCDEIRKVSSGDIMCRQCDNTHWKLNSDGNAYCTNCGAKMDLPKPNTHTHTMIERTYEIDRMVREAIATVAVEWLAVNAGSESERCLRQVVFQLNRIGQFSGDIRHYASDGNLD